MRDLNLLSNHERRHLQPQFVYAERHERARSRRSKRWKSKSGTCRDFALVFIEAARQPRLRRALRHRLSVRSGARRGDATQASGSTHAWADVYMPGAGWVEYDPTDVLIAGEKLIRVAVTRDPSQAIPISGTFTGAGTEFLGMTSL